jgi:hypothetical protein
VVSAGIDKCGVECDWRGWQLYGTVHTTVNLRLRTIRAARRQRMRAALLQKNNAPRATRERAPRCSRKITRRQRTRAALLQKTRATRAATQYSSRLSRTPFLLIGLQTILEIVVQLMFLISLQNLLMMFMSIFQQLTVLISLCLM